MYSLFNYSFFDRWKRYATRLPLIGGLFTDIIQIHIKHLKEPAQIASL